MFFDSLGTNCWPPVSIQHMNPEWRVLKALRRVAVGALLLVLTAAAFVQGQQWLLRWHAERLLNDIRQIQMGNSNWIDAQKLMTKWGAWGGYYGSCTAERCDYHIAMQDWFRGMPATTFDGTDQKFILDHRQCCGWAKPIYHLLGGRFAVVQSWIQVRNGIIWTKAFSVQIANTSEDYSPKQDTGGYLDPLVAYAGGSTHSYPFDFDLDHPEYSINTGPCSVCTLVSTQFTPLTDEKTMDKLLEVDLSCLTRWRECRTQAEIMPEAYKLAEAEKNEPDKIRRNSSECRDPIDLAARDARYATIAEIAQVKERRNSEEVVRVASFRSLRSLKSNAYVGPLLFKDELALRPEFKLSGGVPASNLKLGDTIILLFGAGPDERGAVSRTYDLCSFIPATPENLATVKRGIALDAVPREY